MRQECGCDAGACAVAAAAPQSSPEDDFEKLLQRSVDALHQRNFSQAVDLYKRVTVSHVVPAVHSLDRVPLKE